MVKIVDPHLHLFDLSKGNYGWLKPQNPPNWPDKHKINQNFSQDDLILNSGLELSGFVHVEAGFDNDNPENEVKWLTQTCDKLFAAVACVNLTLTPSTFSKQIQKIKSYSKARGVRHILDQQAIQILSNKQCITNLNTLAEAGLSFDAQFSIADKQACLLLIEQLKRQPKAKMIINHAGFPTQNNYQQWRENLNLFANIDNLTVKCSGFEMINRQYQTQWVKQIIEDCLAVFGKNKVMLASNFPLCIFSKSYQHYWQMIIDIAHSIEPEIEQQLCCDNAKRVYG